MMERNSVTTFKVLIIGDSGVGKTSLLLRLTTNDFDLTQPATVGLNFKTKLITVGENTVKLSIFDTAGQERFCSLTPSFYKGAQGAVLVYDVNNLSSFIKLRMWLNDLDRYSTESNIVKIIVGNKTDVNRRQVSRESGSKFAKINQSLFIEASAKTADSVELAFEKLVDKIIQTSDLWKPNSAKGNLHLNEDNQVQGSGCTCSLL